MRKLKEGDYVTISYDGMLESGEIFESATTDNPFEFVVGEKSVFPSFETGLIGMAPGETRTIRVGPEEAYGQRREELIQTLDRGVFGEKIEPQPGMILGVTVEKDGRNHQVPVMILTVNGDQVSVDYNHPLAGQELLYRITILAIAAAGEAGVGNKSGRN
jgi:FKBP-type peptidyl-prolyl cis-trans isomerase 2